MSSEATNLTRLLEESNWVRALARRLVADPHLADDVAQEAWLVALERARAGEPPTRSWFAGVLRNRVFKARRGAARRLRREERASRPEAVEDGLVERAAVHRDVVQAVTGLEEIYRTVILMRYLEEKGAGVIALELGVPLETVKTRLARGLRKLRERLDAEYGGDGRAWLAALAPFAGGGRVSHDGGREIGAGGSRGPGVVARASLIGGGVAIGALGVVWFVSEGRRADPPTSDPNELAATLERSPTPELGAPGALQPDRRRAVEPAAVGLSTTSSTTGANLTATGATGALRGRVFLPDGEGLEGVRVVHRPGEDPVEAESAAAVTGTGGRFELGAPWDEGLVLVDDEELATVFAAKVEPGIGDAELVVVAAPSGRVGGRVVDASGRALPGVLVHQLLPPRVRNASGLVMDLSVPVESSIRTGEDGAFVFERMPLIEGAELVARRGPSGVCVAVAPTRSCEDLSLVLSEPAPPGRALVGRVVDQAGRPVADARVALGLQGGWTGPDGSFELSLEGAAGLEERLVASIAGFEPARCTGERSADGVRWSEPLTLQLGPPCRALEGRVLDELGRACAGLRVWLEEAELLSLEPDGAVLLENALAGDVNAPYYRTTDADGRFRFEAVVDRDYTLAAVRPRSLERARLGSVRPGTQHALTFRPDAPAARVAGRVVDTLGRPIAGVPVQAGVRTYVAFQRGHDVAAEGERSAPVLSDARGRFVFEALAAAADSLSASSPLHMPASIPLGERHDRQGELLFVLERRLHLVVELAEPLPGTAVAVVDGAGEPLALHVYQGMNERLSALRLRIEDGVSPQFSVPESAAELLLLQGGETVRRVALRDAVPGALLRLRL